MAAFSSTHFLYEDFQSQVPFHTQVPYDQNLHTTRTGHSSTPARQYVIESEIQTNNEEGTGLQPVDDYQVNAAQITGRRRSDAEWQQQSSPLRRDAGLKTQSVITTRLNTKEREATSPGASIECEPLGSASGLPAAENSSVITHSIRGPNLTHQPFPLVDWIRNIRKETKIQQPTLPLRWSRRISERQKAILDTDDAWYPPLAGRPSRQGTIPIDLLTALTEQVDREAEKRLHNRMQSPDQESSLGPVKQKGTFQPLLTQNDLPSPALTDNPASQAEQEVPWSSSPPSARRRRLPPDTSPTWPPPKQGQYPAAAEQMDPFVNEPRRMDNQGNLDIMQETMLHLPPDPGQSRAEQSSHITCPGVVEGNGNARITNEESRRVRQQETILSSPSDQDLHSNSFVQNARNLGTVMRPEHKVLVKDTPHPLKGPLRALKRKHTTEELPQSSLVAGTYPEAVLRNRRLNISPSPRATPASPSLPAYITAVPFDAISMEAEHRSPEWSLKRRLDDVNYEAAVDTRKSAISRNRSNSTSSDEANDCPPPKRNKTPEEGSSTGALRSEEHNSETSSETDIEAKKAKELEILRRKKEESRIQRLKWAKKKPEHRIKSSQSLHSRTGHERVTTTSRAPSADSSRANVSVPQSDRNTTSTTDLSGRNLSLLENLENIGSSQQAAMQVVGSGEPLMKLFRSFNLSYPDYKGNMKTFEAAIRILFSHQLHSSLYDDFVYRRAGEYQLYRQKCAEQDEDVLSYRNYYDSRVEQSECRNNVVTRQDLKNLEIQLTGSLATRSKAISPPSDLHLVAVDLHTPSPGVSEGRTKRTIPRDVSGLRTSSVSKPVAAAKHIQMVEGPSKENESEVSAVALSGKSRKRRSLPWGGEAHRSAQAVHKLQQTEVPAVSAERENLTTTAEHWLSRPAGARSPEIEMTPVRTLAATARIPSFKNGLPQAANRSTHGSQEKDLDIQASHLPTHLMTPQDPAVKDVDSMTPAHSSVITASDITLRVERPVTPFTLFARNFANLQTEKSFRTLSAGEKRLPVNMYNW